MEEPEALAPVWKALADPTRRAILDLLRDRPRTTGEVAAAFPSSRIAVMKHLDVLAQCGLVVSRKHGRERWHHLNAVPLRQLYERWVRAYEGHWAERLLRFREQVEKGEEQMSEAASTLGTARVARLEMEIPIEAPPQRVWQALVDETGSWWRRDFYALTDPAGFKIEARAGGRGYEYAADGSELLWFTVVNVRPPRVLETVGHLTPDFGGPATMILQLRLEPSASGTVLGLSHSIVGGISDDLAANMREGWQLLFGEGLKPYVESRS